MATGRASLAAERPERSAAPRAAGRPWRMFRRGQAVAGRWLSIRWKLTIWYAVIYGATLLVIGIALPRVVEARTDQQIDQRLQTTAQRIDALLASPLVGPPNPHPRPVPGCSGAAPSVMAYCGQITKALDRYSGRIAAPGQFARVELHDPTSAETNHALPPSVSISPIVDMLVLSDVASGGHPEYQTVSTGGQQIRAYFAPLRPPGYLLNLSAAECRGLRPCGVAGVIEVFQAETTYAQIQDALLLIILIGTPVMLLIALLVGWLISRAALRPIGRISRTVQAVGQSQDLSRRIDFVGPRDEVGRLADTFDGMMERLERAFETQKRFVADASHELRTPLTAIRGNADLMRIAPAEERDVCLTAIRRESERMSRLVADLLLLAEADISEQPVHMLPMDVLPLVEEVYRSAQVLAADKVEIVLEPSDAAIVNGDADRLKQLLLNLVDNAVKFTPQGGTISLRAVREGGSACIQVSDTGVGIAPEEQEAIFGRFYRVERARSTRGSGLGLAICAWIAEAHGGSIDVQSEPGKGSTFSVRLPIIDPALITQPRDQSKGLSSRLISD